MVLMLRNADSPLGRFLKGGANAAKNIFSFGFGKVRCYGWWFSDNIRTLFQSHVFFTVITPPVLLFIFSAFLFLSEWWEKNCGKHKYWGL